MKPSRLAQLALVTTFVTSSAPAQDPSITEFRIELRADAERISMRCTHGCAWKNLTVGCGPAEPCGFVLDQYGMGQ